MRGCEFHTITHVFVVIASLIEDNLLLLSRKFVVVFCTRYLDDRIFIKNTFQDTVVTQSKKSDMLWFAF